MERFWYPKLSRWKAVSLTVFFFLLVTMIFVSQNSFPQHPPNMLRSRVVPDSANMSSAWSRTPQELNYSDHIRYKHTNRHLPQCIIIGSRKAGTRALLNYLNLHPDIRIAKTEVHYFDEAENYQGGLEWYRKRMPYSFQGQVTVEKTPAYFVTRGVPQRVHQMNSTVKLLLIVRDPTERAVSDYLQIYLNQVEKYGSGPSFRELAINKETGQVDLTYQAITRSLYDRYMRRWLEYFPLEQFHLVSGERLVQNPFPEMTEIETFLGLEHRLTEDMFYYNATRKFFCLRDDTFHKCLNPSKGRQHPDIGKDVTRKLREFYAPHNREFYFLVKKDFGWPER